MFFALLTRLYFMAYKPHPPSAPLLIGHDPETEIGEDHLARFIDKVVDSLPYPKSPEGAGQPAYHPQMLAKVSLLAYSTGVHSSRRIEQNCNENLPYMLLARDDRPCFRTICSARVEYKEYFERAWLHMLAMGSANGVKVLGRIAIDSTKFKADCSGDLTISAQDYDALVARLHEHMEKAEKIDAQEEREGQSVQTGTGVPVRRVQMVNIVRSVGKPMVEGEVTSRMLARIEASIETLEKAKTDGLKHVSLSDPDARMMPIGRSKKIGLGHMFEVAVDSGLLVAAGSTNACSDTGRLKGLVDEAKKNDPVKVTQVLADSGYYQGGQIVELLESGLEVIVPDATTAGEMRRPETESVEKVEFTKIEGRNAYLCPEGKVLVYKGREESGGQTIKQYKAQKLCTGCPLASKCLSKEDVKYRTIRVQEHAAQIKPYLERFKDPEFRKLYYIRGPEVETVFAVAHTNMAFHRWSVRGEDNIASEAALLAAAYQVRKLYRKLGGRLPKAA
jgi:transposase